MAMQLLWHTPSSPRAPRPPASCHPGQCAPDTSNRDPGALSLELRLSGHHQGLPAHPREQRGRQTAHAASHLPTRVLAQTRQLGPAPWGRGRGAGRVTFGQPMTLLSLEFSRLCSGGDRTHGEEGRALAKPPEWNRGVRRGRGKHLPEQLRGPHHSRRRTDAHLTLRAAHPRPPGDGHQAHFAGEAQGSDLPSRSHGPFPGTFKCH